MMLDVSPVSCQSRDESGGLTHQQINGQGRQLFANPLITHVLRSLTIKDSDEYILDNPLYLDSSKAVTFFCSFKLRSACVQNADEAPRILS